MGCSQSRNVEINFELKNSIDNTYNIIIKKQIYNNITDYNLIEESLIEKIDKKDGLEMFLNILNNIYNNIDKINDDYITLFKMHTKNMIKNILPENEKDLKLKVIDKFVKNKHDIDTIKDFISLFEFIYNNKNKIKKFQIICYIESLYNLLKELKEQLINENEITVFINKLYEIFLGYIPNDKDVLFQNISEIDNIKQSTISAYSLSSQNQIKKMEKQIAELKATVELLTKEKKNNNDNSRNNNNSYVNNKNNSNNNVNNEDININNNSNFGNNDNSKKIMDFDNDKFELLYNSFINKFTKEEINEFVNNGKIFKEDNPLKETGNTSKNN